MKNQLASPRIQSVDVLRGIIILIMALDHVRDIFTPTSFSVEDISQTTPLWFFTRWITHFCAPLFVLLAGTGSYFYFLKYGKTTTQKFLLTRGIWLIIIELVVIHFALTFNFHGLWLLVFWVIGWSMILLSIFLYLPRWAMYSVVILMIMGHNLLDHIHFSSPIWYFLREQNFTVSLAGLPVFFIYPLIPWPGVMLLGFLLGKTIAENHQSVNANLIKAGILLTVLFIVFRIVNGYGDPHAWAISNRGFTYTMLDFFKVTKYPPSFLFLAMTLGPGLIILGVIHQWKNRITDILVIFGKTPFFFFVVHLFVIQGFSAIVNGIFYGKWVSFQILSPDKIPPSYHPKLWMTYAALIFVIVVMYFLCRWYSKIKTTHSYWWLKYI